MKFWSREYRTKVVSKYLRLVLQLLNSSSYTADCDCFQKTTHFLSIYTNFTVFAQKFAKLWIFRKISVLQLLPCSVWIFSPGWSSPNTTLRNCTDWINFEYFLGLSDFVSATRSTELQLLISLTRSFVDRKCLLLIYVLQTLTGINRSNRGKVVEIFRTPLKE